MQQLIIGKTAVKKENGAINCRGCSKKN